MEDENKPVEEVTEAIEESQIEDNQEAEVGEQTETNEDNGSNTSESDEVINKAKEEARIGANQRYRQKNAIKARNEELERENEHLSQRLRQQYEPQQPVQPQYRDPEAKPLLADYDDPDQWADDRDNWSHRQLQRSNAVNKVSSSYSDACEKYAEANPAFIEDVQNSPILSQMNPFVTNAVKKSSDGARITHLLANDDRLASQLNNMSPDDAMRKVIELEGKAKPVKSASTSSAPRSPSVRKGDNSSSAGVDISKLSHAEYRKHREEQRQNRR
jgi:hypothetical protein